MCNERLLPAPRINVTCLSFIALNVHTADTSDAAKPARIADMRSSRKTCVFQSPHLRAGSWHSVWGVAYAGLVFRPHGVISQESHSFQPYHPFVP